MRADVRRRNRQRAIEYYGGVCQLCGGSNHLEIQVKSASELNHKLGSRIEYSWETLLRLLPYYMLACRRHRFGYHGEDDIAQHGTATNYNNHGCRCDLCKKAWSSYIRSRKTGVA